MSSPLLAQVFQRYKRNFPFASTYLNILLNMQPLNFNDMHKAISRRTFLYQTGVSLITLPIISCSTSKHSGSLVPGMELGYSAITWGGNDVQAIKDISALGFKGVQLRSNILKEYGSKPQ